MSLPLQKEFTGDWKGKPAHGLLLRHHILILEESNSDLGQTNRLRVEGVSAIRRSHAV